MKKAQPLNLAFIHDRLTLGEAQVLDWDSDIDLEEKTLTVNKSMYYKNTNEFYITEPNTKASNRVIATFHILEQHSK